MAMLQRPLADKLEIRIHTLIIKRQLAQGALITCLSKQLILAQSEPEQGIHSSLAVYSPLLPSQGSRPHTLALGVSLRRRMNIMLMAPLQPARERIPIQKILKARQREILKPLRRKSFARRTIHGMLSKHQRRLQRQLKSM